MRTLLTALIILATSSFAAAVDITITPLEYAPEGRWYEGPESFENAFPPSGWHLNIENSSYTWFKGGEPAFDGVHSATIFGDTHGSYSDEWLGFNYSYTANEILTFAMRGDRTLTGTCYMYIGEDLILDFSADWPLNWDEWGLVTVDLGTTNYVGFPNVAFDWNYVGTMGPTVRLDMVEITQGVSTAVGDWSTLKTLY